MNAFLALVWFEIRDRRALIAAAAIASLLPLLAQLLPSTGHNLPSDIREAVMWVMVFGLVPLFALLLGVSFIGRDLAEGRLGFCFAQPISGPTIWFGKFTAMVILVWTSQVIVMLPTVLLAPEQLHLIAPKGPLGPYDPLWFTVLPLWLGPIAVLLLAHAVGTVWRARSAWVVFDLLGFLVVVGLSWVLFRPFFFHFTPGVVKIGFLWLILFLVVGLFLAGMTQMISGRVDPRRGHRALSLTLWSVLIIGVATLGGWTWWIRSGSPRDLSAVHQIAMGGGDWIAVRGPSPGRVDFQPRFIMNVSDGRWFRAHSSNLWDMRDVVFSENSSRTVWLAPVTFGRSKLMVADLGEDAPAGRESGLDFDVFVRRMALSADGDRVAVIQDRTVAVYDLETLTQLAAVKLDDDVEPHWLAFENPDRIRIESMEKNKEQTGSHLFRTWFLQVSEKALSDGGEPRTQFHRKTLARGEASSLVSFYDIGNDEQRLILVDENSGERVAELGKMTNWSNLRVVEDRLVVFRWGHDGNRIEVFDGYGELLHRIELGAVGAIYDGGEFERGRVLVGLWTWGSNLDVSPSMSSILVDVLTGDVLHTLDNFAPVIGIWGSGVSPGAWSPDSTAGRVVFREDYSLHLWDPDTREMKQMIPVID